MPVTGEIRPARVKGRSSLANGSKVLSEVDGRSVLARRYRDILDAIVIEYGLVNEADLALARALATQGVWLEAETARMARGEAHDSVMITRSLNAVRRLRRDLQSNAHRNRRRP